MKKTGNRSNILGTCLNPLWTCHFAPELELLEKHIKKGDHVSVIECNADLPFCDANPNHELKKCIECNYLQNRGFSLLSTKPKIIRQQNKNANFESKKYKALNQLKKIMFGNLDLGQAAFSSLTDVSISSKPCIQTYEKIINKILASCLLTYKFAKKTLKKSRFHKVYIFNGRFAGARAWVRACESTKTEFITHERMLNANSINLTTNDLPHNPENYKSKIEKFIKSNKKMLKLKKAKEYLINRSRGIDKAWPSWVKDQKKNNLPENIKKAQKYYLFFSTTERENDAAEPFAKRPLFKSQIETVNFLARECKKLNILLVIRIHPASKKEDFKWWRELSVRPQSITVIEPESTVSSYELLYKADKVIVASSTMGVEATFWGKPSIATDIIYYKNLDIVYEPKTKKELVVLLKKNLKPKTKKNALLYIAYELFGGQKTDLCTPVTNFKTLFKNSKWESSNLLFKMTLKIRTILNYYFNKIFIFSKTK